MLNHLTGRKEQMNNRIILSLLLSGKQRKTNKQTNKTKDYCQDVLLITQQIYSSSSNSNSTICILGVHPSPRDSMNKEIFAVLDDIRIANKENPRMLNF